MIPHIGSARETRDRFTSDLAIDVEFSTGAIRTSEARVRVGAGTDVEGVRSSVSLGSTASRSTLTTSGNKSTTDVSSSGGNVVPGVGSAGKTRDSVTTDLAVDIELSTGRNSGNNVRVSIGSTSDVKGVRSRVGLSSEAQD